MEGFLQNFVVHLDELRRCLVRSSLMFICCGGVCFYQAPTILPWIIKPAQRLVFTSPADAFNAHVTVAIVLGLIIASPYIIFQIWSFVSRGLNDKERKFIVIFAPLSLVFFLSGVAFAFWVAVPMSYQFLMNFSSDYLVPMISVDKYFKFIGQMVLAFGVTFELPLIMAFFASIGIATPAFLIQKRRHAIFIIVIVAAILTPPDVGSLVILAVPLILLYELGIVFVRMFYKHKTL